MRKTIKGLVRHSTTKVPQDNKEVSIVELGRIQDKLKVWSTRNLMTFF